MFWREEWVKANRRRQIACVLRERERRNSGASKEERILNTRGQPSKAMASAQKRWRKEGRQGG